MALPDTSPRKDPGAPPAEDAEALLERIMTDLELPAAGARQRRRFHASARLHVLAPRAALTAATLLLAALLLWLLVRPARIGQVQMQTADGGAAQQVTFTVKGPLLLQVSARLDGAPLAVEHGRGDAYTAKAPRNGELVLEADPLFGRTATQAVTVDGVDDERPHLVSDEREGDVVAIYLSDGNGSGVNWGGITATLASGAGYPSLLVDGNAGCVRLAMPPEELHITVPDRCGNLLHLTLTPDPAS